MAAELTDEQNAMREMALEFARTKLAPFAGEWDPIRRAWLGAIRCSFPLCWSPHLRRQSRLSGPPVAPGRLSRIATFLDSHTTSKLLI